MPIFGGNPITPGLYGDGNQGSATFDGSSVVLGLTPSSTVYSMTAGIQGDSITVNTSTTLKPLGFVLHCATRLNNAGTIHSNGNDAVTSTGGLIINATGSLATAAGNGGDGRNTTGAGSGGAGSGGRNVGGGAGGAGGSAGGPNTGGAGNTTAAPSAVQGTMRHMSNMLKGKLWDGASSSSSSSSVSDSSTDSSVASSSTSSVVSTVGSSAASSATSSTVSSTSCQLYNLLTIKTLFSRV